MKEGMLMAVWKDGEMDKVEWLEENSKKFIGACAEVKGEKWWIGTVYMREERERNYKYLEDLVGGAEERS